MDEAEEIRSSLLRLNAVQRQRLRVLYLAPHAPDAEALLGVPDLDANLGIAPRYNHELYQVLVGLGLNVTPVHALDDFERMVPDFDYVFTIFNQAPFRNSEVFVSSVCARHGVPYLGAPPNIRALAEDKHFTKLAATGLGLPTAPWVVFERPDDPVEAPTFAGPYIVKPRFGASSDGIDPALISDDWALIRPSVRALLTAGKPCLVERCIAGTDVTVPVIGGWGDGVLGVVEEVSELPLGVATHRQKRYLDGGRARRMLEDAGEVAEVAALVQRWCATVRPFDYLRVDFRREATTGKFYMLEFNIGCNLGSHAAIVFAARPSGITQAALIEHLVCYSLARQQPNSR